LGTGKITFLNFTDDFISFILRGVVQGYFVLLKKGKVWYFKRSKLPIEMGEDILEGKYLKPFKITKYKGLKHMHIYDHREFTRCMEDWREYLDITPPRGIVDILICAYPVPSSLPRVRVQRVIYNPEEISDEEVEKWIKDNKLHLWVSTQIRKKHKE